MSNSIDKKSDMPNITVSVILPVYNVAPYIQKCIDSFKRQKLEGLEFIFVDDCSSDGTVEYIERFAKEDNRVKLLRNEKNVGSGPSRNKGIEVARGEYLSFIDPDDWINDIFYESLYAKAIDGDYDIVKGRRVIVKEDGTIDEHNINLLNDRIKVNTKHHLPLYYTFTWEHQSAIYKRTLFNNKDVRYGISRTSQDTTFLLKICFQTNNIALIDEPIYYYLQRLGAATFNYSLKRSKNELVALKERVEFLQNKPNTDINAKYILERTKVIITDFYYAYCEESFSHEVVDDFVNQLKKALFNNGFYHYILKESLEFNVLINHLFIIPTYAKRGEMIFYEGVKRWSDFFVEYPNLVEDNHIKKYIKLLLYLNKSAYRQNNKEGISFCKEQFSRLNNKQKRMVYLYLPIICLSIGINKIKMIFIN